MRKIKKAIFYFKNAVLGYALSSLSFSIIPFASFEHSVPERILAYSVGILFWGGLVYGSVMMLLVNRLRKQRSFKKYCLPGFLGFVRNRKALVADIGMLVAIILFIVFSKLFGAYRFITMITLSLSVFFIYLHSIFNGNNYAYISERRSNL